MTNSAAVSAGSVAAAAGPDASVAAAAGPDASVAAAAGPDASVAAAAEPDASVAVVAGSAGEPAGSVAVASGSAGEPAGSVAVASGSAGEPAGSVAVVTGASQGLGRCLAEGLARAGWRLVVDARTEGDLKAAADELSVLTTVVAIAGDVVDDDHRAALAAAADQLGGADLLVNNASTLGGSPPPALAEFPLPALLETFEVNVLAPIALTQLLLPQLRRAAAGAVLNISSDAAVEAYEGWGGYGAAKAALDHASAVLAKEEPAVRVWAVDPGDLRTRLQQQAFPGEDISDRPPPETVVPKLLGLLRDRPASGRYVAGELR